MRTSSLMLMVRIIWCRNFLVSARNWHTWRLDSSWWNSWTWRPNQKQHTQKSASTRFIFSMFETRYPLLAFVQFLRIIWCWLRRLYPLTRLLCKHSAAEQTGENEGVKIHWAHKTFLLCILMCLYLYRHFIAVQFVILFCYHCYCIHLLAIFIRQRQSKKLCELWNSTQLFK